MTGSAAFEYHFAAEGAADGVEGDTGFAGHRAWRRPTKICATGGVLSHGDNPRLRPTRRKS